MAHELWLIKGSTMTNITPLVGSIGWRGNMDELGDELSFNVAFSDVEFFPKNPCDIGDMVMLKNEGKEITRGIIVDEQKSGRSPVDYTSFDFAFYLNKSESTYQFSKMAADQCIRKILGDFGIAIGNIVSIPVPITKIFPGKKPSDIIKEILEIAEQKLGIKYLMEMRQGKFFIEKQKDLIITAKFTLGDKSYNATDAIMNPSRSRSISDMVNSIQVVGNNDKIVLNKDDDVMIKKYGKIQKVITLDQEEKKSAKEVAENELKLLSKLTEEISIDLIGDDNVRAGRLFKVVEPITGIDGTYLIKDVDHSIENGIHKMSLNLEVQNG
ncbi:XkdQ/YqbQ family protein [Sporosarcina sp. FSL K6-1508]|uniref:XkdQ/YqbQ family protein n=1 Tax=Sporosarcina sp. FSL K6-1508 TaxID=2921553 RepID=UPI0030F8FD4D